MIIESEKATIVRGGNIPSKETAMRIKASAKAFKILSDGLYSDKITAVIREISCNAYDAHVYVETPEIPFHITLPNTLEPSFIVRDFGPGISDEDMDNVFTVFFESTKTDASEKSSFESTGMLGLGCKSPLAYTDSFVVESFQDGVKNSYTIFKNEEGVPTCIRLGTEETTDPSGLKVIIPVEESDFSSFMSKAATVLSYFKTTPKIDGQHIEIEQNSYALASESFGLRKRMVNSHRRSTARAIMGNVCYPLSDLRDDSLSHNQQRVLQLSFDLFFDLGELDVAASRESLSYDKITVENIKAKLDILLAEIGSEIQKETDKCDCLYNARLKYLEIYSGNSITSIASGVKVKYEDTELGMHDLGMLELMREGVDKKSQDRNFRITQYSIPKRQLKQNDTTHVGVSTIFHFVWDDCDKKKVTNRARTFLCEPGNEKHIVYVFSFSDPAFIQKAKDFIGIKGFTKLSDMPVTKAQRRSSGTGGYASYNPMYMKKIFRYDESNVSYGGKNSDYWVPEKVSSQDKIIYVKIDRFKIDGRCPSKYFATYKEAMEENGLDTSNIKVYGVKDGVNIGATWVEYSEHIKSLVLEKIKDNDAYDFFMVSQDGLFKDSIELVKHIESLCMEMKKKKYTFKDKDMDTLVEFYTKDCENFLASSIITKHPINTWGTQYKERVDKASKAIDTKFPMLSCVDFPPNYGWNREVDQRNLVVERVGKYVNNA